MANHRRVPSKTEMRRYLSKGLTQAQIVEAWEKDSGVRVSRAGIGMAIGRYGLESNNPRPRYEDLLPWRVLKEHTSNMDAAMLRAEARLRAGNKLPPRTLKLLTNWKERLRQAGAVVHYDSQTIEGFRWVWPEPGDDDLIHKPTSDPRPGGPHEAQ